MSDSNSHQTKNYLERKTFARKMILTGLLVLPLQLSWTTTHSSPCMILLGEAERLSTIPGSVLSSSQDSAADTNVV